MSVERDEVTRIAELARLRLDSDEADRLTTELNGILEHMKILRGLPGVGPEERAGPGALRSTRASEEGEPDVLRTRPGDFAPIWASGFFVVPPPPGVHREEDDG